MRAKESIVSTIAFLIGVASLVGVSVGAYRELHEGPAGPMPVGIILFLSVPCLLSCISLRRYIIRDPALIPAAIFALCALFYCIGLPHRVGLETAIGDKSTWSTIALGLFGAFIIYSLSGVFIKFVYQGSHSFILIAANALRQKKHSLTSRRTE